MVKHPEVHDVYEYVPYLYGFHSSSIDHFK